MNHLEAVAHLNELHPDALAHGFAPGDINRETPLGDVLPTGVHDELHHAAVSAATAHAADDSIVLSGGHHVMHHVRVRYFQ